MAVAKRLIFSICANNSSLKAAARHEGSQSSMPSSARLFLMSLVCRWSAFLRASGSSSSHRASMDARPACPDGRPVLPGFSGVISRISRRKLSAVSSATSSFASASRARRCHRLASCSCLSLQALPLHCFLCPIFTSHCCPPLDLSQPLYLTRERYDLFHERICPCCQPCHLLPQLSIHLTHTYARPHLIVLLSI
mmetsp:Transcript_83616/g.166944  ORF Transcript_83616/g.166944 Transcript_83616/m.166944 type:complete len:195 (-) Transcript_83616:777-1361(-)